MLCVAVRYGRHISGSEVFLVCDMVCLIRQFEINYGILNIDAMYILRS